MRWTMLLEKPTKGKTMSNSSYSRLQAVTKQIKPYRGTDDYPLFDRKSSRKRFNAFIDTDGNEAFRLFYQCSYGSSNQIGIVRADNTFEFTKDTKDLFGSFGLCLRSGILC
jgi:hypothetical protein